MTEKLLMMGTKQGLDRQELHETLRQITTQMQTKNIPRQNILEDILVFSNENPNAQKICKMYKSLSINPIDYIGNIETQIDTLLQYSRSIYTNKIN
jgi:adenylosuccinate lyase